MVIPDFGDEITWGGGVTGLAEEDEDGCACDWWGGDKGLPEYEDEGCACGC